MSPVDHFVVLSVTPTPSFTLDRRHPVTQKREAENELERSNSELSAFEFQNGILRLTSKVILGENRILSQKERF